MTHQGNHLLNLHAREWATSTIFGFFALGEVDSSHSTCARLSLSAHQCQHPTEPQNSGITRAAEGGGMMFASVRRIALRAPVAAAAAAAIGTLAQPAAAPAHCSWLFGKSKEVQQLEEERARLEEEKRQLQAEKEAALAEKESALKKVAVKGQMTDMAKDVGSTVAVVGSTGIPQSLSYGFVAGYCSGYAAKKAGKLIALAAGGVYAGLQLLAFNGFIKINHDAIEDEFISYADLNDDGSVDGKDLAIAQQRGMEILKFGVPSIGGFGTGFALGLKHS